MIPEESLPATPAGRINLLLTLLEKAPQDIEMLIEQAKEDREAQEALEKLTERIMRIPFEIQRNIARRLAATWP